MGKEVAELTILVVKSMYIDLSWSVCPWYCNEGKERKKGPISSWSKLGRHRLPHDSSGFRDGVTRDLKSLRD